MSMTGERLALLDRFACAGAACEDTCCRGWDMQVDAVHVERYRAERPDLLDAVDPNGGAPVMRRKGTSGTCVMLHDGLCGIHAKSGTDLLGDACHFFPRATRKVGGAASMTATLSCPGIARLALFGEAGGIGRAPAAFDRLPQALREVAPDGIPGDHARAVRDALSGMADDATAPTERALLRIVTVARSLTRLPAGSWHDAIGFLIRTVDQRLPEPAAHPLDGVRLVQTLHGLMAASRHLPSSRLLATVDAMEKAVAIRVDPTTLDVWPGGDMTAAETALAARAHAHAPRLDPLLRRWLALELATAEFPFAGLGTTVEDRATILAVRFATVRLALLAHATDDALPDEATTVRVVQSLARFLDHLADPALSMSLYREAGWHRAGRLAGLIGGDPANSAGQSVPHPATLAQCGRAAADVST